MNTEEKNEFARRITREARLNLCLSILQDTYFQSDSRSDIMRKEIIEKLRDLRQRNRPANNVRP